VLSRDAEYVCLPDALRPVLGEPVLRQALQDADSQMRPRGAPNLNPGPSYR
jgi:hypothetical protein